MPTTPTLDHSYLQRVRHQQTPGAFPSLPSDRYPPFKRIATQGLPSTSLPAQGALSGPSKLGQLPASSPSKFAQASEFTTTGLKNGETQASTTQNTQDTLLQKTQEPEVESENNVFEEAAEGDRFRACFWKDWDRPSNPIEAHVLDIRHFPDFFTEGIDVSARKYLQFRMNELVPVATAHVNSVEITLIGMLKYCKKLETSVFELQSQLEATAKAPATSKDSATTTRLREERNKFKASVHTQEVELKIVKAQYPSSITRCNKAEANLRQEIDKHVITIRELNTSKTKHARLAKNYQQSREMEAELRQRISVLSTHGRSREVSLTVRFREKLPEPIVEDIVDDYVSTRQRMQQAPPAPYPTRVPGVIGLPPRGNSPPPPPSGYTVGATTGLSSRALSESPSLWSAAQSNYERTDGVPEPMTYKGDKDDGVIDRFVDAYELKLEVSYPH
jgi:hypothetical protein